MQNLTEVEIDPITVWQKYETWLKKNIFTVIAIIIILGLVFWQIEQCEEKCSDVNQAIKECNAHWRQQQSEVLGTMNELPEITIGGEYYENNQDTGMQS